MTALQTERRPRTWRARMSNLAFSHLTRGGRAGRGDVRRLGDAWLDE